ncbi:PREDICTED: juxtaposed with another zinc finger protein 1, partial [Phaethon lepturus]|uniref:juxtaposed with another zinc finger protein 1 n=1 Tax=Phaethon lepturus TaxID=97097 RepID=UPI000530A303
EEMSPPALASAHLTNHNHLKQLPRVTAELPSMQLASRRNLPLLSQEQGSEVLTGIREETFNCVCLRPLAEERLQPSPCARLVPWQAARRSQQQPAARVAVCTPDMELRAGDSCSAWERLRKATVPGLTRVQAVEFSRTLLDKSSDKTAVPALLKLTVPRVQKYFKRSIMLSLAFAHSVWDKESQSAGQSFPDVLQSMCSEYDEEEVDYEESDSDESWTTESAISSEAILSSMCMNGGDEKPFACPVPGCKKRYKNVNGIKYHAKNGHRTQIRVRKPFKCRCGKSYKTAQGLRHHTINFHPPVSAEIIRKMQQ